MPPTDIPARSADRRSAGLPRVTAILVVRDGVDWLPSVLATIARQHYPALDLVVVDNGSTDGSADVLARRIPDDRLITLPRNIGFPRAVATALTHPAVEAAPLVLLLHDDLALAPEAITRLVVAMREDPSLGIVGPKLRDWTDEPVLQEIGMTLDRFGRAESLLESAELDQGQHDRQRPVLYVSTAGMLVRTDVLRQLGGLDARFSVFRDDLDLCWRAWLAGHRVEVVPAAVGYHIAASSRAARHLSRRPGQARYFAERHTLATLLKNYGTARLLWVLPVVMLLGGGKVAAFLVTRRFADAAAVVRAYIWNVGQLRQTLRRRRVVQRRRRLSDGELAGLFAPGLPRARVYIEAAGSWLAGGSTRALMEEGDRAVAPGEESGSPLVRTVRRYPSVCAGLALLVVYLLGLRGLLGGAQLVGLELAPWPESARAFLRAYASPWNGEPIGSAAFPSPIQAVLGFVSFLGFGSAWLAQRLVVFGLVPLAWVFALRAGRLVTAWTGPRLLGATLYVLSPAVLGALGQGRFGTLVAAALLPGLAIVAIRAGDGRTPPASAWRAAALLALGLTVVIAAAPGLSPLVVGAYLAVLATALRREGRQPAVRVGAAGGVAAALLLPWVVDLLRGAATGARVAAPAVELPLWRALAAAPEVLPAFAGTAGVRSAITAVAVVVAGVLLGLRTRPTAVAGLVVTVAASGLVTWAAARAGVRWVWAPGFLLPAALALAGLGVVAARTLAAELRGHAFGLRQIAVVLAAGALTVGLAGGIVRLGAGPWHGLERDPQIVPEFVTADEPRVGPYRVLLLTAQENAVAWDLLASSGLSMVEFGTRSGPSLVDLVDDSVAGAVGAADLRAGASLGLANVRYVVVSEEEDARPLLEALGRQPGLEPLPSGGGRVFRVVPWLPRAVVLPPDRGESLLATGDPGDTGPFAEDGLAWARRGVYVGEDPTAEGGLLVVSEDESPAWRAAADGQALERRDLEAVNAFAVPPGAERLTVRAAGGGHRLLVGLQALLLLAVISIALRPPGFTQSRAQRSVAQALPSELAMHERPVDGDTPQVRQ